MTILLLLNLLPQTQLTYETTAKSLASIVQDLSKLSGKQLAVSDRLAGRVMVVSIHNKPLDQIMGKLGEAVYATWVLRDGKQVLVADTAAIAQQQKEFRERRKRWNAEWLPKLKQQFDTPAPTVADFDKVEKINQQAQELINQKRFAEATKLYQTAPRLDSAEDRLHYRLLSKINLNEMVLNNPLTPTIFSTEPAPGARRFSFDPTQDLRQFIEEYNVANRQSQIRTVPIVNLALIQTGANFITDSHLVLRLPEEQTIYSQQMLMGLSRNERMSPEGLENTLQPEDEVAFSNKTLALQKLLQSPYASDPEGLHQRLLHPTTEDPLSFSISDFVLSLSKKSNRDIIAFPPDKDWFGFRPSGDDDKKLMFWINRFCNTEYRVDPDWLILRPETTQDWDSYQAPRQDMESLLNAPDNGMLEAWCRYYAHFKLQLPKVDPEKLDIAPTLPKGRILGLNRLTELFSKLDSTQRQRLLKGEKITLNGLSTNQQEAAKRVFLEDELKGSRINYNQLVLSSENHKSQPGLSVRFSADSCEVNDPTRLGQIMANTEDNGQSTSNPTLCSIQTDTYDITLQDGRTSKRETLAIITPNRKVTPKLLSEMPTQFQTEARRAYAEQKTLNAKQRAREAAQNGKTPPP